MPYARKPYTLDRTVRIVFSVIGMVAALWLLNVLKGVLLPFLVACLVSYMLEPVVQFNKKLTRSRKRLLPVCLTLVEVLGALALFLVMFIPYMAEECRQMADLIRQYATTQIQIPYISERIHEFIRENVDFDQLTDLLSSEQWVDLVKKSLENAWTLLTSSLSFLVGVVSWMIVVLYVIFIMIDYERLMLSFKQLIPGPHRSKVLHIFGDVKNAMNLYFRGQFIIAMTVGVLFAIGFYVIGLPMGIVLGLFIGVLNLVPYLQLISLPITVVLCLMATIGGTHEFWTLFWESMAVYVVVQCIQDLILTPKIMGRAMGLNPAIILLSLSVWGCLLGFMGMIIALPLTTLLLSYYDLYVVRRSGLEPILPDTPDNPSPIDHP